MKGNLFLGTGRGKIGDIVMYRMNGRQMARPRIREVANPRSDRQNLQRMVLATVTGNAAYLRSLISHSFEGVKPGVTSYNHFTKVNMPIVRSSAVSSVETCFRIKGAKTFVPTNGMLLGSGSLGVYGTGLVDGGSAVGLQLLINDSISNVAQLNVTISNSQAYYNYLQDVFGCQPGDEVAILFAIQGPRVVAEFGSARNNDVRLVVGRLVFAEWSEQLAGKALMIDPPSGAGLIFNPAVRADLFDFSLGGDGMPKTTASLVDYLRFDASADITGLRAWLSIAGPSALIVGGAAFLSRYDYARGVWLNSVSTFYSNDASAEAMDVAPSYGNAASEAKDSDYYLEQSTAVAAPGEPVLAYAAGIAATEEGPFYVQLENVSRNDAFSLFFKLTDGVLDTPRLGVSVLQFITTGENNMQVSQVAPTGYDGVYEFQVNFNSTPLAGDFVEVGIVVNDILKTFSFEF